MCVLSSVTITINALARITTLIRSSNARPIVPSSSVLLSFIQQVPVRFSRVNCVLKTCECSCHLELHFLSSRSSQALIVPCLFLVSRKKYSSRYFFISGIAGRRISSRFSKANAQVRTVLVDTCYPISESCQRHCAAKSSNESGSSSRLCYQCRYHWVSFKCPCIWQFKQCCVDANT